MSGFLGFAAEIQFEIDFRKVQIAEREHVRIAIPFAFHAGGAQHFDRATVFAAEIVKVGDVVVALGHEQRHAVADAHLPSALVGGERAREIIQRNQADSHVVKRDGEAFGIAKRQQHLVGALVAGEALLETVLAVINVAEIDFDVGPTLVVAQVAKDFLGVLRCRESLIVFSEQDERLNGGN